MIMMVTARRYLSDNVHVLTKARFKDRIIKPVTTTYSFKVCVLRKVINNVRNVKHKKNFWFGTERRQTWRINSNCKLNNLVDNAKTSHPKIRMVNLCEATG